MEPAADRYRRLAAAFADKIAAVPTGSMDKPIEDVVLERVEIED